MPVELQIQPLSWHGNQELIVYLDLMPDEQQQFAHMLGLIVLELVIHVMKGWYYPFLGLWDQA